MVRDARSTPPRRIKTTTAPAASATGSRLRSSRSVFSPGSMTPGISSAAECEAQNQRLRQTCGRHTLLHRFDFVGYAPEFHRIFSEIGDRKRGSRVAVAWLSDRPWIQKVGGAVLNRQRGELAIARRLEVENA